MRILVYGDSNSFGTGPKPRLSEGPVFAKDVRWPGVMAAALGPDADVIVEGLPGRTTVFDDPVEGEYRNGFRMLQGTLESHQPLDLLIVMLGTNDTKQRFGLGPQDIALGVARLLRVAAQLGVTERMLAICPTPVQERGDLAEIFRGGAARSVGLAGQMERFATAEGAAFLDAGAHVVVDEMDGVHLSAESHAILGRVVADKVREMMR